MGLFADCDMEEFPKQFFQNNISAGNLVPWTTDTLHAALNNGKTLRSTARSFLGKAMKGPPITKILALFYLTERKRAVR